MNSKVVKIRRATIEDAQRISELAQEIALQFIVDEFSKKGRALYLQELAPEVIAKRLGDKEFVPRYAIAAFRRLGFKTEGEIRDEKAVVFQPMTCPGNQSGLAAAG